MPRKPDTKTHVVGDGDGKVTIYWPKDNGSFRVRWKNPDGSRGERREPTEAGARRVQLEVHDELIHRHEARASTTVRVSELVDLYLEARYRDAADGELEPETVDGYRSMLHRHFVPHVGAMQARDVDKVAMRVVLAKVSEELAGSTVLQFRRSVLSTFFTWVRENNEDLSTWNPLAGVKKGSKAPVKDGYRSDKFIPEDARPRTEDVEAIMGRFDELGRSDVALLVALMAFTGLRPGEALAVQPGDFDLSRSVCRVERQHNSKSGVKPYAKGRNWRTVHVPGRIHDRVLAQVDAVAGRPWLFPKYKGSQKTIDLVPWHYTTLHASYWLPHAEPLLPERVRYRSPHGLRHHFATWALKSQDHGGLGLSIAEVSKLMGHQRVSTTEETYTEVTSDLFAKLAEQTKQPPPTFTRLHVVQEPVTPERGEADGRSETPSAEGA